MASSSIFEDGRIGAFTSNGFDAYQAKQCDKLVFLIQYLASTEGQLKIATHQAM